MKILETSSDESQSLDETSDSASKEQNPDAKSKVN
jgi:hypothetical protein